MVSFQIPISPNRRAAGRFIVHVRRSLQAAFLEELKRTGLTQSDVARRLNVDRSVVSRELNGRRDISLGRLAEYAWALGREIVFALPASTHVHGDNKPKDMGFVVPGGDRRRAAATSSTTPYQVEIHRA